MAEFNCNVLKQEYLKLLDKFVAVSRHTNVLDPEIKDIKLCLNLLEKPTNYLSVQKVALLSDVLDQAKVSGTQKMKDFFLSKKTVVDSERFEETDESMYGDSFDKLKNDDEDEEEYDVAHMIPQDFSPDEELKKKIAAQVAMAQKQKMFEREGRRKGRGVKVRRLPPKEKFDAADIAAALGMNDLAKELTVDNPKPFVTVEKNGNVTKRQYVSTDDVEDVNFDELNGLLKEAHEDYSPYRSGGGTPKSVNYKKDKGSTFDSFKKLSDFYGKLEEEVTDVWPDRCDPPKQTVSGSKLGTIKRLEKLVGKYTVEKLEADRKLGLATKALNEANESIAQSTVKDILDVLESEAKQAFADNLKQELDDAFSGRKY